MTRCLLALASFCAAIVLPPQSSNRPNPENLAMFAVHVRGEQLMGAGTPLDASHVLTAAHMVRGVPAAAVDGLPMVVSCAGETKRNQSAIDPVADWVVLRAEERRLRALELKPEQMLRTGDEVLVAGFFLTEAMPSENAFLAIEPSVVTGRVIVPDENPEALVYLAMPEGRDFRGFSGGPAAVRSSSGKLAIFGIVVDQCDLEVEKSAGRASTTATVRGLIIRRVPKGVR